MATEFKNTAGQTKAYTRSTKNMTKPEDSPEEKSKAQSDQISAKGKAAKEASERAASNSKAPQHDFKGDTSLDMANPKSKSDVVSTPKAKPVVKDVPKTKSKFERMQDAYAGFGKEGDSTANKAIQNRIAGKGVDVTAYKSGGSVKSSASSRGDGCAQRGKTRGRFV
jgi:hypothetical protein